MGHRTKYGNWVFLIAVFVAFSALGGLIKIPSPVGSIALDSAPGYFLALYASPILGGIVGALGHIASAGSGGFPLGYIHIYVSIQMFLWCLIFGLIARSFNSLWALFPAGIVATILNGIVGPQVLSYIGVIKKDLADAVMVLLTVASAINIFLASLAMRLLSKSVQRKSSAGT